MIIDQLEAIEWTRQKFKHPDEPMEQFKTEMENLDAFLSKNVAQCESTDGKVFKLKWRDTLEINDVKNAPVRGDCKCC